MIQSILFDKKKWTIPTAIEWLKTHGYKYYKVDETKEHYRFRQFDPIKGRKYRTLPIGAGIEFIDMF
jgi:hypothetical protein